MRHEGVIYTERMFEPAADKILALEMTTELMPATIKFARFMCTKGL